MQWKKKVFKNGNSLAVIIPAELAQYVGLKEGDSIVMQDDKGKHGKFVSFWHSGQKTQENENVSKNR